MLFSTCQDNITTATPCPQGALASAVPVGPSRDSNVQHQQAKATGRTAERPRAFPMARHLLPHVLRLGPHMHVGAQRTTMKPFARGLLCCRSTSQGTEMADWRRTGLYSCIAACHSCMCRRRARVLTDEGWRWLQHICHSQKLCNKGILQDVSTVEWKPTPAPGEGMSYSGIRYPTANSLKSGEKCREAAGLCNCKEHVVQYQMILYYSM